MAGTITHKWEGTTLVVTSDSGTSACDLKGEKGETGIRGPQGEPGVVVAPEVPTGPSQQEFDELEARVSYIEESGVGGDHKCEVSAQEFEALADNVGVMKSDLYGLESDFTELEARVSYIEENGGNGGGSSDKELVTLDTDQTITGAKSFKQPIFVTDEESAMNGIKIGVDKIEQYVYYIPEEDGYMNEFTFPEYGGTFATEGYVSDTVYAAIDEAVKSIEQPYVDIEIDILDYTYDFRVLVPKYNNPNKSLWGVRSLSLESVLQQVPVITFHDGSLHAFKVWYDGNDFIIHAADLLNPSNSLQYYDFCVNGEKASPHYYEDLSYGDVVSISFYEGE